MGVKATALVQYLGAASYAVYLFHYLVLHLAPPMPVWAEVLAAVPAGVAIHAIEKTVRRSFRHKLPHDEVVRIENIRISA